MSITSNENTAAPIVSILVTVYNREAFLAESLRSILKSTFRDLEVVIVDDQSSDRSLSVAREIASTDNRIRVFENKQNLGDYGNRMKAASLARGKYLKYIDSDDLIYPHSLMVMIDGLEQFPDAAIALTHSMPEDDSPYPFKLTPQEAYRKQFLDRGCMSCGPSGVIIRRNAFEASGGFRKEWGVLSDTELWLRMAVTSPVVLLPPGLVWWRRHEGQEFTGGNALDTYIEKGHELNMQALNDAECPLSPGDRDRALAICRQHYARRLLSQAFRYRRPLPALRMFQASHLSIFDLASGLRRYS